MEHLKPKLHLHAQENWMNDPNAPMWYQGYYHLFFQCNPSQPKWGNIHWGHARSKDLMHWEHLPHALVPSREKGEYHCFSGGSILLPGRKPVIYYTSIPCEDPQSSHITEQWAAYALDDTLLHWEKDAQNPLLTDTAHGRTDIKEWRDPYLFHLDEETVGMVMGGSVENQGAVLLYTSKDLQNWKYEHVLFQDPHSRFIECPNFFPVKDCYVLLFSPDKTVEACVGHFHPHTFQFSVEHRMKVDFGGKQNFYATNTCLDPENRWLMWAWMPEGARGDIPGTWAGMQAFPRTLDLSDDHQLRFRFAPTLYRMMGALPSFSLEEQQIISNSSQGFLRLSAPAHMNFELVLFSNKKNEETLVRKTEHSLVIDRKKSSLSGRHDASPVIAELPTSEAAHELEMLWDGSSLEIICNARICLSARVYPEDPSSTGVFLRKKDAGVLRAEHRQL